MKLTNSRLRKAIALGLSLALVVSLTPVPAYASHAAQDAQGSSMLQLAEDALLVRDTEGAFAAQDSQNLQDAQDELASIETSNIDYEQLQEDNASQAKAQADVFDNLVEGTYVEHELIVVYEPEIEPILDGDPNTVSSENSLETMSDESGRSAASLEVEATLDSLGMEEGRLLAESSASRELSGTGAAAYDETHVAVVTFSDETDLNEALNSLNALPGVAFAQPNYVYSLVDEAAVSETEIADFAEGSGVQDATATVSDPYVYEGSGRLTYQWYLHPFASKDEANEHGANVLAAWDLSKCEGAVEVAVIDTGIDIDHPDLVDNIDAANAYNALDDTVGLAGVDDRVGHGTHVSGIIAGSANNGIGIAGVSYNAKILPVRVFEDSGTTSTSAVVSGLQYLDRKKAAGELPLLRVVNMSLGSIGPQGGAAGDALFHNAIISLTDKGVLCVSSGGNGHGNGSFCRQFCPYGDTRNPICPTYPCVYGVYSSGELIAKKSSYNIYPGDWEACLSVTSTGSDGFNSEWSDYSLEKDISAPGVRILSTSPGGEYSLMSGTSMSCPLVAGVAALLFAYDPTLTVGEAREALQVSSVTTLSSKNYRGNKTGSTGVVDAYQAVKYVKVHFDEKDSDRYVSRTAGENRNLTSVACSQAAYPDGLESPSKTLVLARNDGFADAMSASGLAGCLDSPVLLTSTATLKPETAQEIKRLGAERVYVVGGPVAVSDSVVRSIRGMGIAVERIYGENAAETSAACARRISALGGGTAYAVVSSSASFRDALSIGSFCYAERLPVFITTPGKKAQDRKLSSGAVGMLKPGGAYGSSEVLVLGGTEAVSLDCGENLFGSRVTRIAGYSGFDTSNQVAHWLYDNATFNGKPFGSESVVLVNGSNSMKGLDALSAVSLAAKRGAPVLECNVNQDLGERNTVVIAGHDSQGAMGFVLSHSQTIQHAEIIGGSMVMPQTLSNEVSSLLH